MAQSWGMVPRNVADVAKPPRLVRHEMKIFSPDEARRFLDGIKDDPLHPLYIVAITTGMRQGEILGLHWAEVDLEKGMIRVTRALQRIRTQGLILTEPKSEKGRRSIALPPLTVEALRQHRARQDADKVLMGSAWEEYDLVFTSSKGTPLDLRNLVRHFKDTLQELGLPEIRFHDLRHTAATLLLAQGIHPKIVQEMLGHSSITLTLDTYSHMLPSIVGIAMVSLKV